MKRLLPVIALLLLCPVVRASPNEALFAAAGYQVAVSRHLIKADSRYSAALRQAVMLLNRGVSLEDTATQTGIKASALQRLITLGTPTETVKAPSEPDLTVPPEPIWGNTNPEVNNAPKNAYKAK